MFQGIPLLNENRFRDIGMRFLTGEIKDDEVGLVLKINTVNNSTRDRYRTEAKIKQLLQRFPDRTCKIHLLHGFMTDQEMTTLYNHSQIKAFISLAHGEGFGLPIFENGTSET